MDSSRDIWLQLRFTLLLSASESWLQTRVGFKPKFTEELANCQSKNFYYYYYYIINLTIVCLKEP